jgi:hypothetical protein
MITIDECVRRLEDRAALDDLVVRYFLAADGDDLKDVGESFTEDATFASSGVVSATGRQGVIDFIAGARAHMGLTVHTPNYALYTFNDENHATGLIGAHLELVLGGQSLFGAVRYQDGFVRTGEGWRIARRDMRTIYVAPWIEVGDALRSDFPVRWPDTAPRSSDYPRLTVVDSARKTQ